MFIERFSLLQCKILKTYHLHYVYCKLLQDISTVVLLLIHKRVLLVQKITKVNFKTGYLKVCKQLSKIR